MSVSETEEWRAEHDLALWKEVLDVQALFRYQVFSGLRATYLCQEVHLHPVGTRTALTLIDVWCYDAMMSPRMVPRVHLVCGEYEILELKTGSEL